MLITPNLPPASWQLPKGYQLSYEEAAKKEMKENWANITQESPKPNKAIKIQDGIEAACIIYRNGFLKTFFPFIILGGQEIRQSSYNSNKNTVDHHLELFRNFGTVASQSQTNRKDISTFFKEVYPKYKEKEFQTKSDDVVDSFILQGSIINESNWNILRNDMAMLGAVHGEKSFYISTKDGHIPNENEVWSESNNRPTAFGRELLLLSLAGYQLAEHSELQYREPLILSNKNTPNQGEISKNEKNKSHINSVSQKIGLVLIPTQDPFKDNGQPVITLTDYRYAVGNLGGKSDINHNKNEEKTPKEKLMDIVSGLFAKNVNDSADNNCLQI